MFWIGGFLSRFFIGFNLGDSKMNRTQKQTEIEQLKSTMEASEIVIVSHNKGMTVAQVTELRRALRANGAAYKVSKNTLVNAPFKARNTKL
jgi:large subunit ribosomal protein L10